MIPASLTMAGLRTLSNQERLQQAVEFMGRAAKENWVDLLLWNPWPVLDILETFLPFPQRVSQLVALQPFAEAEKCFFTEFLPSTSTAEPGPPLLSSSQKMAPCRGRGVARVVLRGRSFVWRRGDLATKEGHSGLPESILEQMMAAMSHMEHLVYPLEDLGYEVQVLGATYATPYVERLQEAYGHHLVQNFTLMTPPGSQFEGLQAALNLLDGTNQPPACLGPVVLLRFDLVLKRSLGPFLQRAWRRGQEFLAPFWCEGNSFSKNVGGGLCISDVLQVFPGEALPAIWDALQEAKGAIHFHHWMTLLVDQGNILPSKVGVLVPQRFITDPAAQWNPLYDFANRERKPPSLEQRQKNWTVDL